MPPGERKEALNLRLASQDRQAVENLAQRWGTSLTSVGEAALRLLVHPADAWAVGMLSLDGAERIDRIRLHLEAWASTLAQATLDNEKTLQRQEWNLLADVCNGTRWDGGISHPGALLAANAYDGHRLDGAGEKWFGEEEGATAQVTNLCRKLQAMDAVHAWAVVLAIQWFWDHCQEIDHVEDEWWTLAFRREHKEKD